MQVHWGNIVYAWFMRKSYMWINLSILYLYPIAQLSLDTLVFFNSRFDKHSLIAIKLHTFVMLSLSNTIAT